MLQHVKMRGVAQLPYFLYGFRPILLSLSAIILLLPMPLYFPSRLIIPGVGKITDPIASHQQSLGNVSTQAVNDLDGMCGHWYKSKWIWDETWSRGLQHFYAREKPQRPCPTEEESPPNSTSMVGQCVKSTAQGSETLCNDYTDYHELDNSTREIRLLEIMPGKDDESLRCRLFRVPESYWGQDEYEYVALSYAWGNMHEQGTIMLSHSNITREGEISHGPFKPFHVTKNLYDHLKDLRAESGHSRFWIDALCINQGDDDERADQVRMMGQIYGSALQVWIRPGRSSEVKQAVWFIKAISRLSRDTSQLSREALRKMADFSFWIDDERLSPWDLARNLSQLFKQSWFCRVWVLQEVFRARGPVLVHGGVHNIIPWSDVLFAMDLQAWIWAHNLENPFSDIAMIPTVWRSLVEKGHGTLEPGRNESALTLLELFRESCFEMKSKDARDKLFALLGLARETSAASSSHGPTSPRLAIDYSKTVSDVFRDFTIWCIGHYGNLDVLSVVGETARGTCPEYCCDTWADPQASEHPSWALWHVGKAYKMRNNLALDGSDFNLAAHIPIDFELLGTTAYGHTLKLRGLRIGTVRSVVPGAWHVKNFHGIREPALLDCQTRGRYRLSLHDMWGALQSPRVSFPDRESQWMLGCPDSGYNGDEEAMFRDFLETLMLRSPDNRTGNIWEEVHIAETLPRHWKRGDPDMQYMPPGPREYLQVAKAPSEDEMHPLYDFARNVKADGKYLFISDEWRQGLGLPEVQPGDVIVALFGGRVPYILRPKKPKQPEYETEDLEWEFIGECFLHGMMSRSIVDARIQNGAQAEIFHLT